MFTECPLRAPQQCKGKNNIGFSLQGIIMRKHTLKAIALKKKTTTKSICQVFMIELYYNWDGSSKKGEINLGWSYQERGEN